MTSPPRDGVLLPLLDQQPKKDVVILAHSYVAIIASGAAKGLDKPTRDSNGQPVGVIGLIYVAGNIVLDDESLGETMGGVYPPFIKLDKEVLCNECNPAHTADLSRGMVPHAYAAFQTKSAAPPWADKGFDGRRAYRERMGVQWDVVELKAGHMPFISQPKELATEIVKFVESFLAL